MGQNVGCNKGKMLCLQLVCLALVAAASAEETAKPNTRIFGLGNLVNGVIGGLGTALQPGYQQGGFQQGGYVQPGLVSLPAPAPVMAPVETSTNAASIPVCSITPANPLLVME